MELQSYNVKKHYNDVYNNGNHGSYDVKYFFELIDTIQQLNPSSILDVGCGNGCYLYMIHERFPDIDLFGIDFAEEGIKTAIKNVEGVFKVADARSIPFEDSSMDLVISVYSLFSMRYIVRDVVDEIYRICNEHVVLFEPFFCMQNIFGKYHAFRSEYVQGIPFYVQDVGFDIIRFSRTGFAGNNWHSRLGMLVGVKNKLRTSGSEKE